jgi:c-di-GMP-binding flagellar brake protein YcgR
MPVRDNPFAGRGLIPGRNIRLEVNVGQAIEAYSTAVEDISSQRLTVLVPMVRLRPRPLSSGTIVRAYFNDGRRNWKFKSTVRGLTDDGSAMELSVPDDMETADRRRSYRLDTALRPEELYRLVVDAETTDDSDFAAQTTIVDISEGGICLSSRASISAGDRLGIKVVLPQAGEINARVRVISVEEPVNGRRNSRIHCEFIEPAVANRDRVARYLLKRQIELRRNGQL